MMRRVIVMDLFSGPAWRDASDMVGRVEPGAAGGWLMIQPGIVRVVGDSLNGAQILRDGEQGGPSFRCRAWYSTAGTNRPTIHTVATGNADLYEEILTSVGFRQDRPEGIELRRDESGAYWGYYI